jgi:hypothetical protein
MTNVTGGLTASHILEVPQEHNFRVKKNKKCKVLLQGNLNELAVSMGAV